MIPNPLYCEPGDGYGYRVIDAEWEPYAVQCPQVSRRWNATAAGLGSWHTPASVPLPSLWSLG